MSKRGQSEGSIYRRTTDGRWVATVNLGREGGVRKRKSFYGRTRREVWEKQTAAMASVQQGLSVLTERQTLGQFLSVWLTTVQPTIRPRTWKRYREYLTLHIIPAVGAVSLAKLSAQQVQALYATKLSEGLSTTTVRHLHAVLHRALASALRLGLVHRNVTEMVDAPRIQHHDMTPLSAEQVHALLAAAKGDRPEALYVVALTTGMRQGELLALRWSDVNRDAATLQVRGSLQRTHDGLAIHEPKTARSRRRVTLSVPAVEALRQHHTRQIAERIALGPGWDDHDLVFANTVGRPIEATNLLRSSFRPLLMRAGLPRIRFHDLRHTCASLLFAKNVHPKVVQELLGHATISITLDLYSHMLPDMQRDAARAMESVIGG